MQHRAPFLSICPRLRAEAINASLTCCLSVRLVLHFADCGPAAAVFNNSLVAITITHHRERLCRGWKIEPLS